MPIPQTHTGLIPQLVKTIASQWTSESSAACVNVLEAVFYRSLHGEGAFDGRRITKWLHETSFAHVSEFQILFDLANIAFLALSTEKLSGSLQEKYGFSLIHDVPWPSIFAVTGLALINNLARKVAAMNLARVNQNTDEGQVAIAERLSYPQRVAKLLHIAQIVVNVALAYLDNKQLTTAISLGAISYSSWKNSQFHWITFSRKFPCSWSLYPVRKIKATYHLLAIPPKTPNQDGLCPVCLDEDALERISFCANHSLHKLCVMELVRQKTEQFQQVDRIKKFEIKHYHDGVYTKSTFHYEATIDQHNLPACPQCRSVPLQNVLDMSITDAIHGELNSILTVKRTSVDRQYLYENINALYSTAQASLAFLQTYPELAGMIYKIQKFMLVADIICYGATFHYLSKHIHAKHHPNSSRAVNTDIAIIASMAFVAVASWFILLHIQDSLNSTSVLNEGGSDDVFGTLDLSTKAPWHYTMMQTLLVNRMIGSIALTFFSKKRKTNLLSIAMQTASLVGISSLKWIQVIQKLDQNLLFKAVGNGSWKQSALYHIKSSEATHNFLVDSFDRPHLDSKLRSITDFTVNFFKKSRWENYWAVTRTDGVETSRKLWYKIMVHSHPIKELGNSFASHLVETHIKILDALNGEANVIIHAA